MKIALIVGAGAVENAWQPILNAFEKDTGNKIDADGANCYFARLVYLMRFYATGTFPNAKEMSLGINSDVEKVKSKIAKVLQTAQHENKIKARKEFIDILYKFIFSTYNESVLITTNWDTVIDNELNKIAKSNNPDFDGKIESLHIHGSIESPNSLYLPSEIVREPYRSSEDDSAMGTLHGRTWSAIEECNRAILYGLSIDPLDAELSQTLAAGFSSPNLREIIIINPSHQKVSQRVKLLIDERYPVKIFGYSPSNLSEKIDYS